MSALGQKRTLAGVRIMSALPPKADIADSDRHVRFVPKAESCNATFRVWPSRIGSDHRIEELDEPLGSARRERIDRLTDDVGVNMRPKVEANCKAARGRMLRVIVSNGRDSRSIRETDRHWRGIALEMRRSRQRRGFR